VFLAQGFVCFVLLIGVFVYFLFVFSVRIFSSLLGKRLTGISTFIMIHSVSNGT